MVSRCHRCVLTVRSAVVVTGGSFWRVKITPSCSVVSVTTAMPPRIRPEKGSRQRSSRIRDSVSHIDSRVIPPDRLMIINQIELVVERLRSAGERNLRDRPSLSAVDCHRRDSVTTHNRSGPTDSYRKSWSSSGWFTGTVLHTPDTLHAARSTISQHVKEFVLFAAVDPETRDLLHATVTPSQDTLTIRRFLPELTELSGRVPRLW